MPVTRGKLKGAPPELPWTGRCPGGWEHLVPDPPPPQERHRHSLEHLAENRGSRPRSRAGDLADRSALLLPPWKQSLSLQLPSRLASGSSETHVLTDRETEALEDLPRPPAGRGWGCGTRLLAAPGAPGSHRRGLSSCQGAPALPPLTWGSRGALWRSRGCGGQPPSWTAAGGRCMGPHG